MTDRLKSYLPHFAVLLAFIGLSLIYMQPLLEGKVLMQSDIIQFKGMSQEIVDFREKTGEEPLWTGSMFSGMPAYQISVLYPNNWSKKLLEVFNFGLPRPANYLFLLMAGAYFLFVVLGVGWRYALVGAFGVAFASFSVIMIEAGHNSQVHAFAFVAPVLGSILLAYRGKYLLGAALTALFLSLQIATNHLQITYYLLMIVLLLGLVKLIEAAKEGKLPHFAKATGMLVIGAMVAIGPNISALWTTADYGAETIRGKSELSTMQESNGLDQEYATRWSYGVAETFTILIPDFMGGSSSGSLSEKSNVYEALTDNRIPKAQARSIIGNMPLYHGTQPFTSGPVYLGAIICLLAVLGLLAFKGMDRWWLLAAFILSIVLSWGHNFALATDFFFDHVPGYNKFRAVSMTLVIAQVVLPILAVFGLKSILDGTEDRKWKTGRLYIATGVVGGLCLLFALIPSLFFDFTSSSDPQLVQGGYPDWLVDALVEDRQSLFRSDAIRSLGLVALAAGLIFLTLKGKLKAQVTGLVIAALVLGDLWQVDKRYLKSDDFVSARQNKAVFAPSQADQRILSDPDPNFRVLNTTVSTFNDASTSYHHKSIGGYHGAKLKRYQELIDSCISRNNMEVLNMLNTKYFIMRSEQGPQVQQNPMAHGNAWFVNEVSLVPDADAELAALNRPGFSALNTAIIDQRFADEVADLALRPDSAAAITFEEYGPNHLKYAYTAAEPRLAVFSEIYFANGWNAYLDGEPKPHFRANYVLRAMTLPAGDHTVEFRFEPQVYATGEKYSLAGSILLVLFVGGGMFFGLRGGALS
ncbi:MAG: YfhO family protein [Flavobacteriales bacterium]|nr:YfhO family protein [Flavobacteriales bacterium]